MSRRRQVVWNPVPLVAIVVVGLAFGWKWALIPVALVLIGSALP